MSRILATIAARLAAATLAGAIWYVVALAYLDAPGVGVRGWLPGEAALLLVGVVTVGAALFGRWRRAPAAGDAR